MGAPDLHVGGIGGIPCVDLVEEQQSSHLMLSHFLAETGESFQAYLVKIDRRIRKFHCAMLADLIGFSCGI